MLDVQAARLTAAWQAAVDRGLAPIRHLANSAATLTRPDLHFDLVRPGIAVYGLDPLGRPVGQSPLRPAMTLAARVALVKRVPAGEGVSYGHEWTAASDTTLALVPIGYADGVPRRLNVGGRMRVLLGGRLRPVVGRVCMDQVVVDCGPRRRRGGGGRPRGAVRAGGPGEPTAQDWADELGTIHYEVVTGRARRAGPRAPSSTATKRPREGGHDLQTGLAGRRRGRGLAGAAADRRGGQPGRPKASPRRRDRHTLATSCRPAPTTPGRCPPGAPSSVTADDGCGSPARRSSPRPACAADLTVVLVHGFALDRRTWHFQRRFLADLPDPVLRQVIYDQRSHGRSERAPRESCTIDQLGHDLAAVLRALAPDGPLVLVGHSMGGMTIMALAEQQPEFFAERVLGVAFLATSAAEVGAAGCPARSCRAATRSPAGSGLSRAGSRCWSRVPGGWGTTLIWSLTRRFAYGDRRIDPARVDLVDSMISANAVDALTDFVDTLGTHDRIAALPALPAARCWSRRATRTTDPVPAQRGDRRRAAWRDPRAAAGCRAPADARAARADRRRAGRPDRPLGGALPTWRRA